MDKLIDRLGERLEFERRTVAILEALIGKSRAAATPPPDGGPPIEELLGMRDETRRREALLERALSERGADTLRLTPAARASDVASVGLARLVEDPVSTAGSVVEALLIALLIDHEGWELIVELAGEAGATERKIEFETAFTDVAAELEKVRGWVAEAVLANPRRSSRRGAVRTRRGRGRAASPREGVLGVLDSQHQALADLFKRLGREATRSGRRMVFDQLVLAVAAHERVEQGVLVPWLRAHGTEEMAILGLAVDEALHHRLAEIERSGLEGEGFMERLGALRGEVERHRAAMETHLLGRIGELFGTDDLHRLAAALRDVIEVVPVAPRFEDALAHIE